jgi:hypothetical protein
MSVACGSTTWLKENGGFPARWIPYSDLGLGIDGGLVLLGPGTKN